MPMEQREYNLIPLLACCRRELALRTYVFPKRVADGKMKQAKADEEIRLMRELIDFLVDCIFRQVTNQERPPLVKTEKSV